MLSSIDTLHLLDHCMLDKSDLLGDDLFWQRTLGFIHETDFFFEEFDNGQDVADICSVCLHEFA